MFASVCKHTYLHRAESMERTRGAGVSLFPLFIGKAPGKQSQLSRPELIQEFFLFFFFFFYNSLRQETQRCSPLPPLLIRSPVNTLLICRVVSLARREKEAHKADSYPNSLMTRVYLAERSASCCLAWRLC